MRICQSPSIPVNYPELSPIPSTAGNIVYLPKPHLSCLSQILISYLFSLGGLDHTCEEGDDGQGDEEKTRRPSIFVKNVALPMNKKNGHKNASSRVNSTRVVTWKPNTALRWNELARGFR